ncbi:hypothetical protein A0H81_03005 [Grifola frondosa]|uniref:F-box domain-containing protein n=1 Tax=Grifola frondosa TaxID=5627 RepID=A0A1C7MIJ1_GRIFR|nr:hypothetical protein A0H81_03005 [Grifola frondosa]
MLASLSDAICLEIHMQLSGDLAAQIALSQTCRRLYELYGKDSALWQAACFGAGFGRPLKRIHASDETGDLSWRSIAHLLVQHALICEIRSCSHVNASFAEHYKLLSHSRVRAPIHSNTNIIFHPLYFYLHFSQSSYGYPRTASHAASLSPLSPSPSPSPPSTPAPAPDTISILLTHLPTFPECRYAQYGPLCVHPNASCAFATFPPVSRLAFQDANGGIFLEVENRDGCTVLDVNRALAQLIPVDQQHFDVAIGHYRELAHTSGLSLSQFASVLSKDKGFLGDHEYPFLHELAASA